MLGKIADARIEQLKSLRNKEVELIGKMQKENARNLEYTYRGRGITVVLRVMPEASMIFVHVTPTPWARGATVSNVLDFLYQRRRAGSLSDLAQLYT
jgi:hypothetical protein